MSIDRVLEIFKEINTVPRGSGDMEKIAKFCVDFADKNSLKSVRDKANNVIIFKDASKGYEKSEPIILQGHLDMVCQKEQGCDIDFSKDAIEVYQDGDFLRAKGTTLGADNGIAVAMIMAILESDNIPHPAIQALFTSDEEIGLIGAGALDATLLTAKKMINIDGEEDDCIIVSCAGGVDVTADVLKKCKKVCGKRYKVLLKGLTGGHSGVEINSGRVNANILAGRFLNHIKALCDFDIISINGGDKSNAIPNMCEINLCTNNDNFLNLANDYLKVIKTEIAEREPNFNPEIVALSEGEYEVFEKELKEKLIFIMSSAFNGVLDFSMSIKGLVETSLNFGILKTSEENIKIVFSLRSNKVTAMDALKEKLKTFLLLITDDVKESGDYPSWEYKHNSIIREVYREVYKELIGVEPKIEAIHAGLECGVFDSKIKDLDCISIGPNMWEVHTYNERLSISSTEKIFKLLCETLKRS